MVHGEKIRFRPIAGRGQKVKEYVIGAEVFGRGESFDPRLDPIVRTEARKLRARLEKYYETLAREPGEDAVRIELHKGSYVPAFTRIVPGTLQPAGSAETGHVPLTTSTTAETVLPAMTQRRRS